MSSQKLLFDPSIPAIIDIIGAGCRIGDCRNPQDYKSKLFSGAELPLTVCSGIPVQRLQDFKSFDNSFFGIVPRDARFMCPSRKLLLECAWEAMEHAGVVPMDLLGKAYGVFTGSYEGDYRPLQDTPLLSTVGLAHGDVSYFFGLTGMSVVLDSACSSSAAGLYFCFQEIQRGTLQGGFVAGAHLFNTVMVHPSTLGLISRTGRCKTFDQSADGFQLAEGCASLLVERRGDTRMLRTRVHGCAVNNDGRSTSRGAPLQAGQEACFKTALKSSNIQADQILLYEAQGTGASVGDAVESRTCSSVYGSSRPLIMQAIKSIIGHTESASGVFGLLKSAISLRLREIPQQLNFKMLSKFIGSSLLEKSNICLPLERVTFPNGYQFLTGESHFGFGGTNTHTLLESDDDSVSVLRSDTSLGGLVISAANRRSFELLLEAHRTTFIEHGMTSIDLKTSIFSRKRFQTAATLFGHNCREIVRSLALKNLESAPPNSVMLQTIPETLYSLHLVCGGNSPRGGPCREEWLKQPKMGRLHAICSEIMGAKLVIDRFSALGIGSYALGSLILSVPSETCIKEYHESLSNRRDYVVVCSSVWATSRSALDSLDSEGRRWWASRWTFAPLPDVLFRPSSERITFMTPISPLAVEGNSSYLFLQVGRSALLRQVQGTERKVLNASCGRYPLQQPLLMCLTLCKLHRNEPSSGASLPTYQFDEKVFYTEQVVIPQEEKSSRPSAPEQPSRQCVLCHASVQANDGIVHADSSLLHFHCIETYNMMVQECAHCKDRIGSAPMSTFDGLVFHTACFQADHLCPVCHEGIRSWEAITVNGTQKMHPHCAAEFRAALRHACAHCKNPLKEDFFFFSGSKVHPACLAPFRKSIKEKAKAMEVVEKVSVDPEKPANHITIAKPTQYGSDFSGLFFHEGPETFVDIGLSSLVSLRFVRFMNEVLNLNLPGSALSQYPSPKALRQFVFSKFSEQQVREKMQSASARQAMGSLPDPFKEASTLWEDLLKRTSREDKLLRTRQGLLLTGAGGFLGSHILMRLLATGIYEKIFCLLRAKTNVDATERLQTILGVTSLPPSVSAFAGDLEKPSLGLPDEVYAIVGRTCTRIIHCAALVMWVGEYSDYLGPNVMATVRIVEMAYRFSLGVTYISTMGVNSSSGPWKDFSEDFDDLKLNLDYWLDLPLIQRAYPFAKFVGELLVSNLKDHCTLIIRVPMLGPHRYSGKSAPDQYDVRMLLTFAKLGKYYESDAGAPVGKMHWIPIDYTADCVVIADANAQTFNQRFGDNKLHLAHPLNGTPISQILRAMMSFGYELRRTSRENWIHGVRDQQLEAAPLLSIIEDRLDTKEIVFRSSRWSSFLKELKQSAKMKITVQYLWKCFHDLALQHRCPHPVTPLNPEGDLDVPVKAMETEVSSVLQVSWLQQHEIVRGFVQLLLICFLACFVMIPVFPTTLSVNWLVNNLSVFLAPLGVFVFSGCSLLCFVVLKWILMGRLHPGSCAIWNWHFVRWWTVDTARRLINLTLLGRPWITHTVFAYISSLVLGANMHWSASIRADVSDWDLLVMEGDSGTESSLCSHWFVNGHLVFKQTRLCEGSWLGVQAYLEPGAELSPACKLDDGSFLSAEASRGAQWKPGTLLGGGDTRPILETKYRPNVARRNIFVWTIQSFVAVLLRAYVLVGSIAPCIYFFMRINDQFGWLRASLSTPALLALCLFGFLLEICVCKWVLLWKVSPGAYSWKGFYSIRRDIFLATAEFLVFAQTIIGHSVWLSFYLRLLGTSVGKSCSILSIDTPEWDLLRFSDRSVSGASVVYKTWLFDDSQLLLSPIVLGPSCYVVGRSVLQGPIQLESHCTLALGSVLRPGTSQRGILLSGNPALGAASVYTSRAFPSGSSILAGLFFSTLFWILQGVTLSCSVYAFFTFAQFFLVEMFTRWGVPFQYYDYFYALGFYLGAVLVEFIFGVLILIQFSLARKFTESLVPKREKNLEVLKFTGTLLSMLSFLGFAVGGSVYSVWFARIAGAKIGRGCYFDPEYLSDPNFLKLDDGCVVNGYMELGFADATNDAQPGVYLQSGTVMHLGAVIVDGLRAGSNVVILPGSVCDPLKHIMDGAVVQGIPAQQVVKGTESTQSLPL